MNEKGFAATGILYTILVLFILLLLGMITMLYSRNNVLLQIQKEVKGDIHKELNPNLVLNGDLSLKSNTNFTSFTYGEDTDGGFVKYTGSTRELITSDTLIDVNTTQKYNLSLDLKSSNTTSTYFVGIAEYDADKKLIKSEHVMYIPGSLTTLARDLKNGDTVVYLNNVSGFNKDANISDYQKGFIFWNYIDGTGKSYSELTYSRNVFSNLFEVSGINTTDNTITLKQPWSNGNIPAGTKLSQSSMGFDHNFSAVTESTLEKNWKNYSAVIQGVSDDGLNGNKQFRPGTNYVSLVVLFNYNGVYSTTLSMKNISFSQIQ